MLAGCGVGSSTADTSLANGKQLFVSRCGTCHVLSRAGTKGVVGPNLDQAFQQALKDGLGRSTIRGLVREQIDHPIPGSGMPADVVKGQNARDVAAYVASVAAKPGKDAGLLATLGQQTAKGTAKAKNGTLEIDAAQAGLAYAFKSATAPAGKLTIKSKNPQPVGHDIAIEGNGVNAKGEVVQNGGVLAVQRRPQARQATRSSAPSPATVRAAWWGPSPSSSAGGGALARLPLRAGALLALARLGPGVVHRRAPEEEAQRRPASARCRRSSSARRRSAGRRGARGRGGAAGRRRRRRRRACA